MSLLWFVHFLLLFYKIITLFAAARRGRCLVIIRRIEFLNRYSRGRTDSRSWSPNSEPPSSAPIFRSPPSRARITPISRVLARRFESRQERDLHRRIQGIRSRHVPRGSAGGMSALLAGRETMWGAIKVWGSLPEPAPLPRGTSRKAS